MAPKHSKVLETILHLRDHSKGIKKLYSLHALAQTLSKSWVGHLTTQWWFGTSNLTWDRSGLSAIKALCTRLQSRHHPTRLCQAQQMRQSESGTILLKETLKSLSHTQHQLRQWACLRMDHYSCLVVTTNHWSASSYKTASSSFQSQHIRTGSQRLSFLLTLGWLGLAQWTDQSSCGIWHQNRWSAGSTTMIKVSHPFDSIPTVLVSLAAPWIIQSRYGTFAANVSFSTMTLTTLKFQASLSIPTDDI